MGYFRFLKRRASLALLLVLSAKSYALEIGLSVGSETELTDNSFFQDVNKKNEIEQVFSTQFSAVERRKNFEVDTDISLEHRLFLNDSYDNDTTLSTGFGVLNFNIIESFITWESSFTRSQSLDDPFGADIDSNRQKQDVFSTGPRVSYQINPTSLLYLSTEFIGVENSDEDDPDTHRLLSSLGYNWLYTRTMTLGASLGYEKILKADGGQNYSRNSVGLSYSQEIVQGNLSVSFGLVDTNIENELPEIIMDEQAGVETNYSLSVSRRDVFKHDLNLLVSREISDNSLGFESSVNDSEDSTDNSSGNSSLLEGNSATVVRDTYRLGLSRIVDSFTYSLVFEVVEEESKLALQSEREKGFEFDIDWSLMPTTSLGFETSYTDVKTRSLRSRQKEERLEAEVSLNHNLSPDFIIGAYLGHNTRRFERSNTTEELVAGLTLDWTVY